MSAEEGEALMHWSYGEQRVLKRQRSCEGRTPYRRMALCCTRAKGVYPGVSHPSGLCTRPKPLSTGEKRHARTHVFIRIAGLDHLVSHLSCLSQSTHTAAPQNSIVLTHFINVPC